MIPAPWRTFDRPRHLHRQPWFEARETRSDRRRGLSVVRSRILLFKRTILLIKRGAAGGRHRCGDDSGSRRIRSGWRSIRKQASEEWRWEKRDIERADLSSAFCDTRGIRGLLRCAAPTALQRPRADRRSLFLTPRRLGCSGEGGRSERRSPAFLSRSLSASFVSGDRTSAHRATHTECAERGDMGNEAGRRRAQSAKGGDADRPASKAKQSTVQTLEPKGGRKRKAHQSARISIIMPRTAQEVTGVCAASERAGSTV